MWRARETGQSGQRGSRDKLGERRKMRQYNRNRTEKQKNKQLTLHKKGRKEEEKEEAWKKAKATISNKSSIN